MLVLNGKQSMKPQAICVCAVLQKTQKGLPSTANLSLRGLVFRKGIQKCTAKSAENAVLFSLFFLSVEKVDVKLPLCVFKVTISNSHPCVQAHSGTHSESPDPDWVLLKFPC